MADDSLRYSHSLYRDLVARLRSRPAWVLDDAAGDPEDEIAAVTEGETAMGELFFAQTEAEAQITLRFPDVEQGGAAQLLLDRPLDHRLKPSKDGFVGRLCRAQAGIASAHETPYLEPAADPSLLATVHVPPEPDDEILERTLDALDAIADETSQLHDELEGALTPYLDDADADPTTATSITEWEYLGSVRIKANAERISVPEDIFADGGVDPASERVYWSYNRDSGAVVLTNEPTGDGYESVATSALRTGESGNRLQVPAQLRPDDSDDNESSLDGDPVPLTTGERRHVVRRRAGTDDGIRMVYLVTDAQLQARLDGSVDQF